MDVRRARGGRARRSPGRLHALGVRRGDVVLTLVGNRAGMGAHAARRASARATSCCPARSSCGRRTSRCGWPSRSRGSWSPTGATRTLLSRLDRATTLWVPFDDASHTPPPPAELAPEDPCLVTFTSGHLRRAEGGRCTASATCPARRCRPSTGWRPQPGQLVWCTAAAGWSKSARNAFIAPWLRGAAALLHDARFDPHERLELIARERVDVLCMAPTEYRVIAKRATLRPLPALRGAGGGGRGAQPRGAARLARGHRAVDPRRLRPDRDRPADRRAARRDAAARARWAARCPASRSTSSTASWCSTRPATRRSSCTTWASRRTPARGAPATA